MKGMKIIHRDPVYSMAIATLLIIALVGVVLSRSVIHRENKREARSALLADRLRTIRNTSPGLTPANLTVLKLEVDALERQIAGYAATYTATEALETSRDPAVVLPRIQGLLMQYRRQFRERGIRIGKGETFGFARYQEGADPSGAVAIETLYQQLQVIETLLELLLESEPSEFLSMEREWVEGGGSDQAQASTGEDVFRVDPHATARVPGLVDTLAFRLRFAGHTEALRRFMNALSGLEIPVMVREVEVRPHNVSKDGTNGRGDTTAGSPFSAWYENGERQTRERPRNGAGESQPVIEENYSEFTVVLEYIELNVNGVVGMEEGKGGA